MFIGSIGKIRISIGTRDKEIHFLIEPIRTPELVGLPLPWSAHSRDLVEHRGFGSAPWDFRLVQSVSGRPPS